MSTSSMHAALGSNLRDHIQSPRLSVSVSGLNDSASSTDLQQRGDGRLSFVISEEPEEEDTDDPRQQQRRRSSDWSWCSPHELLGVEFGHQRVAACQGNRRRKPNRELIREVLRRGCVFREEDEEEQA
eukprot:m.221023 g.221023  ORF g.221023 m.221023 type:complete len:128 (-) comp22284_c1_seq1:88-471(-)